MKKILLIIATITVLVGSGTAYTRLTGHEQYALAGINNQQPAQREQVKDYVEAIKAKVETATRNRAESAALQSRLNTQIREIKKRAAELRKNPASLNKEKIETISQSLQRINRGKKMLEATRGTIAAKNAALREARRDRKPVFFVNTLDQIIQIQEKRISVLNQMIDELNKLEHQLSRP